MPAIATRTVVAFAACLLACGAAWSQEAKEGRVDVTLCFGGPVHTLGPTAQDRFGTCESTGGGIAASGPASSGSFECLGVWEVRGRVSQHRGYCLFQRAAGNKIYGTDIRNAQGYTWEYLLGTGKFEGITGSGSTEILGSITPVRPCTLQGCRRMQGNFKLP